MSELKPRVLAIFAAGLLCGVAGTATVGELLAAPTEQLQVINLEESDGFELAKGDAKVNLLLEAAKGSSKAALSIVESKPGWKVPEHAHEESAEILYLLDGGGTFMFDGKPTKVKKGHAIYVPPGLKHSFVAEGKRNLKAVQVYAAPGPEQRFRKIGKPIK